MSQTVGKVWGLKKIYLGCWMEGAQRQAYFGGGVDLASRLLIPQPCSDTVTLQAVHMGMPSHNRFTMRWPFLVRNDESWNLSVKKITRKSRIHLSPGPERNSTLHSRIRYISLWRTRSCFCQAARTISVRGGERSIWFPNIVMRSKGNLTVQGGFVQRGSFQMQRSWLVSLSLKERWPRGHQFPLQSGKLSHTRWCFI